MAIYFKRVYQDLDLTQYVLEFQTVMILTSH